MGVVRHWVPVYVGIGSNLQMPARQIQDAIGLLENMPESRLVRQSSLYRSAPFGGVEQPDFVNAVAAMLTTLPPREFLEALQRIEMRQGRERNGTRWGPRILDLDLLVYSHATIGESGMTVPHPGIAERNFVLLPLGEIAPELVVPGLGRVADLPVNTDEPAISRIE
jgi:2-amino-4-hydroxy-6-hydroxymethyldihydropteridine diphosphokinase